MQHKDSNNIRDQFKLDNGNNKCQNGNNKTIKLMQEESR